MPAQLPLRAHAAALLGGLLDWASPGWAARAYALAVAAAPGAAELHFARGRALALCTRWREAARAFAVASHLTPASVDYQGWLVLALARHGATEAALEALRRLAALRPFDGEVHVLVGTLQRRCGRPAEALRSFRLAVALEPAPPTRRFLLGEMLLGREAWEETLAVYGSVRGNEAKAPQSADPVRSALNFHPGRAHPAREARVRAERRLASLGRCWRGLRATVAGVSARLPLLSRRAGDALARAQRLRAIRRAARELRASRAIGLVLVVASLASAGPVAADALRARARHETAAAREQARLCERQEGESALVACRAALELGIGAARERAVRELLARRLVELEHWEELAELHREGVRRDPGDAALWQRLGTTLLFALDQPAEAAAALEEAARLAPSDALTRLTLGLALAASRRPAEAAAQIDKALLLDPALLDGRPAARAAFEAARQGRSWP